MLKRVNSFIPVLIVPVLISAALAGCRTAGSPDPGKAQTPVYQESQGLETEGMGEMEMPGEKNTQLLEAAAKGDAEKVRTLIGEGADVNARDSHGNTPVMAAAINRRPEAVRVLLEAGADVNIRNDRSDNLFLYAGAEGDMELLRLAISAGADPALTNRYGGTALIPASERGHTDIVRELLTRTQVDVNHVNRLGWTALLEAVILGDGGEVHRTIIRLLLDHGADVHLPDGDGVTAYRHAVSRNFTAIAEMLEAAGGR
ncbi:ankyrin repeat domain-containing protein [Paenibacillus chitinolyticus]|uniref:ankyrin repeat domain-containing protein n=1 Tax=Paenibacillus chitinolyticus TaxID=79263 RepID=UPI00386FBE76